MIILNKGQVNIIYTTVSDIVPSDSGEYKLILTHTVSNVETPISMSRTNSDTIRYDAFEINEASHSLAVGKYNYRIEDYSGSIAEYGKAEVISTSSASTQYTRTDNTKKFYEG